MVGEPGEGVEFLPPLVELDAAAAGGAGRVFGVDRRDHQHHTGHAGDAPVGVGVGDARRDDDLQPVPRVVPHAHPAVEAGHAAAEEAVELEFERFEVVGVDPGEADVARVAEAGGGGATSAAERAPAQAQAAPLGAQHAVAGGTEARGGDLWPPRPAAAAGGLEVGLAAAQPASADLGPQRGRGIVVAHPGAGFVVAALQAAQALLHACGRVAGPGLAWIVHPRSLPRWGRWSGVP